MMLDSMDLWGMVDKSKATLLPNVDSKVKKMYQRWVKKSMYIIMLNVCSINLCTSKVTKDKWKHRKPCITFMIFPSFATKSSYVRRKKIMTYWIMSTMLRHLQINSFAWRYSYKMMLSWLCSRACHLCTITILKMMPIKKLTMEQQIT